MTSLSPTGNQAFEVGTWSINGGGKFSETKSKKKQELTSDVRIVSLRKKEIRVNKLQNKRLSLVFKLNKINSRSHSHKKKKKSK